MSKHFGWNLLKCGVDGNLKRQQPSLALVGPNKLLLPRRYVGDPYRCVHHLLIRCVFGTIFVDHDPRSNRTLRTKTVTA